MRHAFRLCRGRVYATLIRHKIRMRTVIIIAWAGRLVFGRGRGKLISFNNAFLSRGKKTWRPYALPSLRLKCCFILILQKGSCESLAHQRIAGSVPGLLDELSCSSTADIDVSTTGEEERAIPHVITECIRHLEANGLHTLGLFRVSASKKRVREVSITPI